jgi:4-hydroxy-3-polyprenylbenzoate decarboxylase
MENFIKKIEKAGELIRIKEKISTELEITEITDRISKMQNGGKALLFENNGTDFPVLINLFGSLKRMNLALGTKNLDQVAQRIEELFKDLASPKEGLMGKLKMLPTLNSLASYMPKVIKTKGAACQEVVHYEPDLDMLPILKCWPHDGGKFITLPMVHTKDLETGIRNVGMYRMQIFDKTTTGMHWHKHKTGARHFEQYKKAGKKMPVAVALGGDPIYTYSATAPLPDNIDEYILAGFLRQEKVELVKCLTQDIEIPIDADIVIEGYIDPQEALIWEGPFGDHTGFYSLADWYPAFHVTCITHKLRAVYPTTIVGVPPQEDAYIGKATERIFLSPMRLAMIPELQDMYLPEEGVAHNLTIVKINKTYSGQAQKVMNALWGAGQMMFNKILVVVNQNIDIFNSMELAQIISQNVDIQSDIYFSKGPLDVLDHAAQKFAFGSKMGIDATIKNPEELNTNFIQNFSFSNLKINKNQILEKYAEIFDVNTDLLSNEISVLLISVKPEGKLKINDLFLNLLNEENLDKVKFFIFFDQEVPLNELNIVTWLASGNLDPQRDTIIAKAKTPQNFSHLAINATAKTKEANGFERSWPNIVTMNDETIKKIDEIWNRLGFSMLTTIESPSLKFKNFIKSDSAVAW